MKNNCIFEIDSLISYTLKIRQGCDGGAKAL